jgi:hypothetical protein
MMIVIYWNIKRIVFGVKTTLCEMKAALNKNASVALDAPFVIDRSVQIS